MEYAELQLVLAKLLPDKLFVYKNPSTTHSTVFWTEAIEPSPVKETEWLHICNLIELSLNDEKYELFLHCLADEVADGEPRWAKSVLPSSMLRVSASWQKRAIALAKIKEIKI